MISSIKFPAKVLTLIYFLTIVPQLYPSDLQLTQTIRGKVIDHDSKSALVGANVIVLNTDSMLGSSKNLGCEFEITNVSLGRHNIKVTYIGYKPAVIPNVLIGSGKEIVLNIELVESLASTEVVLVEAEVAKEEPINEMASISARAFSVEETSRYAASINDPACMALSFAGVTNSSSDAMNEIVIRGNSPRGMLWYIESVPVSNPNHFAEEGNTGRANCLISNNMLDNSDFLTGSWPVSFGDAISDKLVLIAKFNPNSTPFYFKN